MPTLTFRTDQATKILLDNYAREHGKSRSEVLNGLISKTFAEDSKPSPLELLDGLVVDTEGLPNAEDRKAVMPGLIAKKYDRPS